MARNRWYVLDRYDDPIPCFSSARWRAWAGEHIYYVALDYRTARCKTFRISTVFVGRDRAVMPYDPPLLYETAVFGTDKLVLQRPYTTRAKAIAGHQAILAKIGGYEADEEEIEAWESQFDPPMDGHEFYRFTRVWDLHSPNY